MSRLRIEVFTSPTCPHCPAAVDATERLLAENPELREKIKWAKLSTATEKGRKKANTYGIRGVPTIILTNSKGEKGGITGAPSQESYLKAVYEMLGEEIPQPKKEEDILEKSNSPKESKKPFWKKILGG